MSAITYGQVGINTRDPKATLHIKEGATSVADGLIIPNFTAAQLNTRNTVYGTDQNATLVFVISGTGTAGTKTENIAGEGFYYYDATAAKWIGLGTSANEYQFGELKRGFQSADHDGWVKLDGRAVSSATLTTSQKAKLALLNITGSIPNPSNTVFVQNGTALGSLSGSNTRVLAQNQLPNVTVSGTTNTTGAHTHLITGAYINPPSNAHRAAGATRYRPGNVATNAAGDHSHTLSFPLNGNVAQQVINIFPQGLSVNVFMYLGS